MLFPDHLFGVLRPQRTSRRHMVLGGRVIVENGW